MSANTLDNQLDIIDEYIETGHLYDAKLILDLIKPLIKRNDNPQIALRYSKTCRNYNASIKKELISDKQTQTVPSENGNLDRLIEAKKQLEESEQVGRETLNHLQQQRETLERVKGNLKETNDGLNTSNKFLNRMSSWWRR